MAVILKFRKVSHYNINTPFIIIKAEKKFGLLVDELVTVDTAEELGASKNPIFLGELRWQDKKIELLNATEVFARGKHDNR